LEEGLSLQIAPRRKPGSTVPPFEPLMNGSRLSPGSGRISTIVDLAG
jgi:hypothetical protein